MEKKSFILFAFVATLFGGLGFSSCSSDDDPKYGDVTITAGSTQTLSEGKNLDWKSENGYIATISNGKINAQRVGKVKMISKDGSFHVNVTPQYTYYEEPYIQFGASAKNVKSAMKGYTLLTEDNEYLIYEGKGYTYLIMYSFENSKLKYSYFYTSESYSKQLAAWTSERYVTVTTTDDYIGMLSVDEKLIVVLQPTELNNSWYYMVGYGEFSNNSNAKSINFDNMLGQSSGSTEYLKTYANNLKIAIK